MNKKYDWGEIITSVVFFGGLATFIIWAVASSYIDNHKITCKDEPIAYSYQQRGDGSSEEDSGSIHSMTQKGVDGVANVCKKGNGTEVSRSVIKQPVDQIDTYTKPPEPPTYDVLDDGPDNSISQYQECPITTCRDGSCSQSTGRGTCSWHGGIAY